MSRLAKKPIIIPEGVKVSVKDAEISVEGKLGKNKQTYLSNYVDVKVESGSLSVNRKGDSGPFKAYQGLFYRLAQNLLTGVSQGFNKSLSIQGLGYKWEVKGKVLVLTVGYSNPVNYNIPDGITLKLENPQTLVVSGFDKQHVGQIAAEIRSIRPPEPYKGKGIRYVDERVKLKEGKSAK